MFPFLRLMRLLVDFYCASYTRPPGPMSLVFQKQQVQGIRMGSARQAAKLHHTVDEHEEGSQPGHPVSASVDEIVYYLRQQDDVVVPQENAEFLVNGRFGLQLDELVSRANRMRARQAKPELRIAGHPPSGELNLKRRMAIVRAQAMVN